MKAFDGMGPQSHLMESDDIMVGRLTRSKLVALDLKILKM